MLFALIMVLGIALVLLGVGLVLGAAVLGLLVVLVITGIISTSVLVAVTRRRLGDGVRALFIQLGAVAGLLCGAAIAAVVLWLNTWVTWSMSGMLPILLSAVGGAAAGAVVAALFNLAWMRTVVFLRHRRPALNVRERLRLSSTT